MDWLEFTNSMTGNLSWPVTIIVLAYMLRSPLSRILLALRKVKIKDVELDFDRAMESIQKDMSNSKKIKWEVSSTEYLRPNMEWLVEKSHLGVILQAWDILELTILKIAEKESNQTFHRTSAAVTWIDENHEETDLVNIYYRLFDLKTKVTSFESEVMTKERALDISDIILNVASILENKFA